MLEDQSVTLTTEFSCWYVVLMLQGMYIGKSWDLKEVFVLWKTQ